MRVSSVGFSKPFDLSHSYNFVFCTEGWIICQGLSEPDTGEAMSVLSSYKIKACTTPVSDVMFAKYSYFTDNCLFKPKSTRARGHM
ncbi:hypothetical protein HAX54_042835 [Datura stramonium]|uniref:Uncharacterized protein n=1 Tax=Datura stramonium TaxID=4076 RepID=A0ABS8W3Q2_DATST|nr:hypothetical protein [Datura stramonium]